ncbi:zinc finger protein CONSTANS-LIKE 2-like [Senna tora]|uniref:Zinc finger protein CONSTANS-LIKE 2-like n=1 Tax=Senna tora TaxID=362788 RepID=A0A834TJS4_9FABA|nr:zinc finger protein CONSTANS-LIKE 2-like [Senna tora]
MAKSPSMNEILPRKQIGICTMPMCHSSSNLHPKREKEYTKFRKNQPIAERKIQDPNIVRKEEMKNCELCKVPARTYCESDQASLCWDCDSKVHGANFLVARHSRTLLCRACQSITPWKASGPKLGNTVSFCESCAGGMKVIGEEREESEGGNDDDIDTEGDLSDDEDDDSDEDDDDDDGGDGDAEVGGDEDGDNQVVPLSSTPPPPASNSSSSQESVSRCNNNSRDLSETVNTSSLKRRREDASDQNFQDGSKRPSIQQRYGAELRKQVAWLSSLGGGGASTESPRFLKDAEIGSASSDESLDGLNGPQCSSDGKTPEAV